MVRWLLAVWGLALVSSSLASAHGTTVALGGIVDGIGQIQFGFRPLSGPFAQSAQCHLDIAGAKFDGIVKILVLALVPNLHRPTLA